MMTPIHAILVLLIRLWAATLIISSITTLSYYLPLDKSGAENASVNYIIIGAVHAGTWLVLGLFGWMSAHWLAKRVYARTDIEGISLSVDADTLVMIGSFLIGVFYLTQYVPQLFTHAATIFVELAAEDTSDPYVHGKLRSSTFAMRNLVGDLPVVLVASWMAFRPSHIVHLFSSLRRAGLAKIEERSPEK